MKTDNPGHTETTTTAYRFFWGLLRWRWLVIIGCFVAIGLVGRYLPTMTKDTTPEAFVPRDSPALAYRDHVEAVFGLKDPMVIAVTSSGKNGIYTPGALQLVEHLTQALTTIEGIDPDGITSLATEKDIRGVRDGMLVESFWEVPPQTMAEAKSVRERVENFPLMLGTLAARDGSSTLLIAETLPEANDEQVYHALLALAGQITAEGQQQGWLGDDLQLHVAGQGAVSGYLSAYIAADASRLNPIAALIITAVLLLAFRTVAGTLLPNLVVFGTVAVGLGSMAAAGVPMYVITNSLPVILIGIAVCDSIHIFTQYYEELTNNPQLSGQQAVARAMSAMWRPVTLTTLTTVAGFVGLSLAASLPPMQSYGIFAAVGILAAWAWTLLLLPALLSLFKPRIKTTVKNAAKNARGGITTAIMAACGGIVARYPVHILLCTGLLLMIAIGGASRIEFNDQRIHSFQEQEPLRIADGIINQHFDGTYYLDVAIETPQPEDLFQPDKLRKIEALQYWMEQHGGLQNTTSIVDHIKQMHQALHEGNPAYYAIPDDSALIAQYFLLYSASGEPDDFEQEIDYDYRQAHVRGQLKADNFQDVEPIVLGLKQYLKEEFDAPGIRGNTTGAIDLSYSWLKPLAGNTAAGMALALILVLVSSTVFFRSLILGMIATLPVAFSVLMVFAIMGYAGIWIGIGTSMFAAIAIGLGVDFAIHTIDRLRTLIRDQQMDYPEAVAILFPSTGRALLFNLLALALGFGVLMTSKVPPLQDFGLLVAIAVFTSFVISMTSMTALIGVLRPRALFGQRDEPASKLSTPKLQQGFATIGVLQILTGITLLILAITAFADDHNTGQTIMQAVDARPEGITQRANLTLTLTDRRGRKRIQQTIVQRKYYGADKRQVLYYLEPTNVRDTAFLTYDYADPNTEDEQWLYLPALRKTRRISASDRGDYFLGTDLTYEEMKRQNKISLQDWRFTRIEESLVDGINTIVVEGTPVNEQVAEELGYGRARWYVDPATHTIRRSENFDVQGNPLKTAIFTDVRKIDDIWTVHEITVDNHKTGHQTHLLISDVAYDTPLDDERFEERTLRRGVR
ncbi:outer membrane lipoprotein-sorting protein [Microbulbifer sp. CAU 1566]|uniref:outer membrane lipoprotein-sorting protein n=1 Tax=Microbulbifer sp. CAU 1566 TaxID=2933269 RepID=UPI002002E0AE|nr:outer membrane lipoprotein-sorting protein [Microbulbifer sp. CAU 1566]MCK7597755.1 outer membrane lipoprotein-sorting protein [Microbulbifer sp. CAU 1566]